jgi:hypothetical protein
MTTPYSQVGAKLIDNGYRAIPILPGTKRPGEYTMKNWYGTRSGNGSATACQPKSKSARGRNGPTLACAWPSITA